MAAGDVKGDNAIVIKLTAGAAVVKGQVVHMEADFKFDPCIGTDTGKFAVAIEAASGDTVEFRAVIFGEVEVTAGGAITQGANVIASTTGEAATSAGATATNLHVGTAMEAIASGETGTIFVGLVN